MSERKYPRHEDWNVLYPGISGMNRNSCGIEKPPVMPNVADILSMGDDEFDRWYYTAKGALVRQLEDYKVIGNLPDLIHDNSENLGERHSLRHIIYTLKDGLAYLERIKQVRKEMSTPN